MVTSKQTNLLHNKKIAIVGGGPGGLTLARLLQLKGADVKVYERDHSQAARVQGAIVDLHFDSGLKVMETAGLLQEFKANYLPGADNFRIVVDVPAICYTLFRGKIDHPFAGKEMQQMLKQHDRR